MQHSVLSNSILSNQRSGQKASERFNHLADNQPESPKDPKIRIIVPALVWVAGLLLAGSEGPLMPYLNIAGGILFFGASIWLGRLLPGLDPDRKADTAPMPAPAPACCSWNGHGISAQGCFCRDLLVIPSHVRLLSKA